MRVTNHYHKIHPHNKFGISTCKRDRDMGYVKILYIQGQSLRSRSKSRKSTILVIFIQTWINKKNLATLHAKQTKVWALKGISKVKVKGQDQGQWAKVLPHATLPNQDASTMRIWQLSMQERERYWSDKVFLSARSKVKVKVAELLFLCITLLHPKMHLHT